MTIAIQNQPETVNCLLVCQSCMAGVSAQLKVSYLCLIIWM